MLHSKCGLGSRVVHALPSGITVARPTREDCFALAPALRQADRDEVTAASGSLPEASLLAGLATDCHVIKSHGKPIAMLGVGTTQYDDRVGVPWFLSSQEMFDHHTIPFLRRCRAVVDDWQQRYPLLVNFTDCRNTVHHEWLRWLGFTFIARHEHFGAARIPFLEFVRIAPCANQRRSRRPPSQ